MCKIAKIDIKKIVAEKGYDWSEYSRSKAVIAINKVLNNTDIKVELQDKGMVWRGKDGVKSNMRFSLNGMISATYVDASQPLQVARFLSLFLQQDRISTELKLHIGSGICEKCEGKGIIPAFHYYCSGICFDCGGTGRAKKTEVMLSSKPKASDVNKYYISKSYEFFPKGTTYVHTLKFGSKGWEGTNVLSEDNENYYIHAPVSECNDWMQVPKSEWLFFLDAVVKSKRLKFIIEFIEELRALPNQNSAYQHT